MPRIEEDRIVDVEPFAGQRAVDWQPSREGAVLVDDLDDGFRIQGKEQESGFRIGGVGTQAALDAGLPRSELGRPPATWSRRPLPGAWGRYRRTVAIVRSGPGGGRATFTAELPDAGRWRLELHMPSSSTSGGAFQVGRPGTYELLLADGTRSEEIRFDASASEAGWNDLGSFELPAGEVRVELSRQSDGSTVIADAIRWLPRDAAPAEAVGAGDG
jgi:hypothetical protein